jgi:hydrogenase-4 membrane subunit HyfE
MGEIYEIIPISAGVILAFIFARYRPSSPRMRWGITAVVSVVVGLVASIVSGEIHESWAFVILDTAQVALTMVLVSWLLDRRSHRSAAEAKRDVE